MNQPYPEWRLQGIRILKYWAYFLAVEILALVSKVETGSSVNDYIRSLVLTQYWVDRKVPTYAPTIITLFTVNSLYQIFETESLSYRYWFLMFYDFQVDSCWLIEQL